MDLSCNNGTLICKQAKGIKYRIVTHPTRRVGHVVHEQKGVILLKIRMYDPQDWLSKPTGSLSNSNGHFPFRFHSVDCGISRALNLHDVNFLNLHLESQ